MCYRLEYFRTFRTFRGQIAFLENHGGKLTRINPSFFYLVFYVLEWIDEKWKIHGRIACPGAGVSGIPVSGFGRELENGFDHHLNRIHAPWRNPQTLHLRWLGYFSAAGMERRTGQREEPGAHR